MKKIWLVCFVIILALVASPAFAAKKKKSSGGFVQEIGAGIGILSYPGLDSGFLLSGHARKDLGDVMENLTLDIEGGFTLKKPSLGVSGFETTYSLFYVGAYGTYNYEIDKKISVYGKGGLLFESDEFANSLFPTFNVTTSGVVFAIGGGATYQIKKDMKGFAEWVDLGVTTVLRAGIIKPL